MRKANFAGEAMKKFKLWMPYIIKHFPTNRSKYVDTIKGDKVLQELAFILQVETKSENAVNEARKRFRPNNDYTEEDVENALLKALKSCTYFDLSQKTYKLNELEEKLLDCNGASEKDIEYLVDRMLEGVQKETPSGTNLKVESKVIVESIEKADFGDMDNHRKLLEKAKDYLLRSTEKKEKEEKNPTRSKKMQQKSIDQKLKPKLYSLEVVKNDLKLMMYEELVKPPREWDFLIILSRLKMIVNVEVKKQIDLKNRKDHQLNGSLNSASSQCREHADYAARVLAPFLGEGWQFVKVAAIVPGKLDHESICGHCDQFIITGKDDRELQEKVNKIRDLLIAESSVNDVEEGHEDFVTLTKVLLGLSSLSTEHASNGSAWKQIQGSDPDHVSLSAGWTKSDLEMGLGDLTFKNVLNQPHNFNKLVFYNVDQQHVLANNLTLVVLKGDFGAGNKKFCDSLSFNYVNQFIDYIPPQINLIL